MDHMHATHRKQNGILARCEELLSEDACFGQFGDSEIIRPLIRELLHGYQHLQAVNEELVRAYYQLRESRREYLDLYNSSPAGHVILDRECGILRANNRFLEIVKNDWASLHGRKFAMLLDEQSRDAFIALSIQARHAHASVSGAIVLLTSDNIAAPAHISLRTAVAAAKSGQLHLVVSEIASKPLERVGVFESDNRYRSLVENAQAGIWITDATGGITFANRRIAAMAGLSASDLEGRDARDFIVAPAMSSASSGIQDRRKRGIREKHLRHVGGSLVRVLEASSPLYENGCFAGVLSVFTDLSYCRGVAIMPSITCNENAGTAAEDQRYRSPERAHQLTRFAATDAAKRHQALEQLYAISTAFRGSLESMCDQVALCLADITQAPYAAVCQFDNMRIKDMSVFTEGKLLHATDIAIEAHPCGIIVEKRRSLSICGNLRELFPCYTQDFDGSLDSYLGAPITDEHGDIQGAVCLCTRDRRLFAEDELRLIATFARFIGHEISRRKLENQLRQAQEMNFMGQLASGVAHEVRNPLNAIMAITEALFVDIGDAPEFLPYVEHIRGQVGRLSTLMEDLLKLGRPVVRTALQPIPMFSAMSQATDAWRQTSRHSDRAVQMTLSPETENVSICIDSNKFQQVFINLIDNACQNSPVETPIGIMANMADAHNLRIRVIDQGSGIPEEQLERIAEPFFTTRKEGIGLGIPIVRRIVEQHRGSIHFVNNDPEPGLTVEILLPIHHGNRE
jgi:PAS domain S-box-containing protein